MLSTREGDDGLQGVFATDPITKYLFNYVLVSSEMSGMAAKLSTLIKSGGKLKPHAFKKLQCANRRFKVRKTNRRI